MHIGVDPGRGGAIAVLHGDQVAVLPKLGRYSEKDILAWLVDVVGGAGTQPRAVLEWVHSSPQMGVVSAFTFGREYGRLTAILSAMDVEYAEVRPQTWQKDMECLTKGDKNITKRKAQYMFPGIRVTHYTADALLLAKYCQRFEQELFT